VTAAAAPELIAWDAGPAFVVAFTTRVGGVSEGPYASLNLGRMTDDDPASVDANRALLCEAVGADVGKLALNRQEHRAAVNRARAGSRGEPGDGLWTDEPGVPMVKLTADCVPVVVASRSGRALGLIHAGWRGLLEGVIGAGVAALGGGARACVGPAIGPCCYEVGPEVAGPFREHFGRDAVVGTNADLWTATERALRAADVADVERIDLCTSCNAELFFSHRRDGGVTGRQGVIGYVAG
jgi:YfiH family protein